MVSGPGSPCALHGQEHCPLCDGTPPPVPPHVSRHNMAVDSAGTVLPYSSTEVQQVVQTALRDGDVVAAILRLPGGNLVFQVFGPPSEEVLHTLETVTHAYKRTLEGH